MKTFGRIILASFMVFLAVGGRQAAAFETVAREAIIIDMETDTVLYEHNADQLTMPSSMTKMMTVYLLFERLKEGGLSLDDTFPVSENAWRKGGSKMFVEVGKRIRVEDLIRGIIVQSGNDACIVVAEALAGSEEAFAEQMTRRAHSLGMKDTTFKNASGWPDPEHMTTVRDLAILGKRTIRDFPEFYHYYSETEFTFSGIKQSNRNPILYAGVGGDGLKTGHTEDAGYGLVATAMRNDRRIIAVFNGTDSMKARAQESERMISWAFREFGNYALFKSGETVVDADVWLGDKVTVPLVIPKDVTITIPRKSRQTMTVSVKYDSPLSAPLRKGDSVAKLVIAAPNVDSREIPLTVGADVNQLGLVGRLGAALRYILLGATSG
ncbi:MAG: D-alanyl-D-alanine carboxypeptidase [Rhodospirillales bacterium]|nr:D-alanyl-D-alanine carboxypeptidase [Rhodospirillales bacterium]MCW8862646.1 D-alanyl-D-alanine carboxypeptidase [Rhodospirillales bacterium]MCW8970679.1 D-alanyl-D-alanine carboxypeptidase [Rhodospirillales bacterium]MCW9039862.1 D-alanyl-D-alanine carboxypeptidase [Rhodospirillales bacterium]